MSQGRSQNGSDVVLLVQFPLKQQILSEILQPRVWDEPARQFADSCIPPQVLGLGTVILY